MIRASVSSDREDVSATCPRVARGKLAGVGHRFGETEINRSHAAAFRLRCIESPAIRSILAHPFYSIRDIPYDKYLGLIFIRAKGPLPSDPAKIYEAEIVARTDFGIYGDCI